MPLEGKIFIICVEGEKKKKPDKKYTPVKLQCQHSQSVEKTCACNCDF